MGKYLDALFETVPFRSLVVLPVPQAVQAK